MPDARKQAQARRERRRRHKAESARARQAQEAQAEADARRRRYRSRRQRRIAAWTLFTLAIVIAVTHLLEHAGAFQVMSPGLQDLLIGYPAAAVLAVLGGVVLGRR